MILIIKVKKEKKSKLTIQRQNVNNRHKDFIETNDHIEQTTKSNENNYINVEFRDKKKNRELSNKIRISVFHWTQNSKTKTKKKQS